MTLYLLTACEDQVSRYVALPVNTAQTWEKSYGFPLYDKVRDFILTRKNKLDEIFSSIIWTE